MLGVVENDRSVGLGLLDAVVAWCDCLQGRRPIREALRKIAVSLEADAVGLSRVSRHYGGPARIIAHDDRSIELRHETIDRSFAREVMQEYLGKASIGSVWFARMLDGDMDPALAQFQRREHLHDLAVIPLATTGKHVDCLEIHFHHAPTKDQIAALNMLVSSLLDTWKTRQPGVFSQALAQSHARKAPETSVQAPVLSFENPARLSRMEYRVCVLLQRGQTTDDVQSELAITQATLRTHLRNIYAKTGAKGMSQLIYTLMSGTPAAACA